MKTKPKTIAKGSLKTAFGDFFARPFSGCRISLVKIPDETRRQREMRHRQPEIHCPPCPTSFQAAQTC
ncbi:hypothetical protein GCWU000324_02166 [Kingella oralis ATCC 51147]|uniref:Uncharacterized protein n=1 Tax=Kingella oralis ATCC 51147 TaxID=629741 RepID=C4GJE3_9NEIS|nr:hypothetical protein GCWU000324_02166 [Kingella oralis ATCC 51147]